MNEKFESNLTVKSKPNDLDSELEQLKKQLGNVSGAIDFIKNYGSILSKGISQIGENSNSNLDEEDKIELRRLEEKLLKLKREFSLFSDEKKLIIEKLDELKQSLQEIRAGIDKIEFKKGIDYNDGKVKKNEISPEKLKTITNREFLSLDKTDRLQYVTRNHIDYENIKNGNVSEIVFFFDQDGNGKDDSDLYRLTTLGQVLGKEIGEVESNGKVYIRGGLDGEFFNGNQKLTIHTNTKVIIKKIRTQEEIDLLDKGIIEGSKKYKDINNFDLVREALARGIDPKLANIIFGEKIDTLPIGSIERRVLTEEFFTQFARLKSAIFMLHGKTLEGKKYPDELVIRLLKQYNADSWKEKAILYGINEEKISYVEKNMYATFESIHLSGDLEKRTVSLIKVFEGFSPRSYFDYRQYTRGYGTKAKGPGMYISESQAHKELIDKLRSDYLPAVKKLVKDVKYPIGDNQIAALTSFAFNLGIGVLNNFEGLIKGYPETIDEIANKMQLYTKAGGKTLRSLVNRRTTEAKLFSAKV